jgi:predicted RNA-binding protein (virulence factor B family)
MTPFEDVLGRVASFTLCRFGSPGAFLVADTDAPALGPAAPVLLLPGAEVPEGAREGRRLDVFVYRDSEDRPIATTRRPRVVLGEVAFLEVTAVTHFGAFVDWGLAKELLVPFAEHTRDVAVGERHPIGLFIDGTGRLAGTMRVAEILDHNDDARRDFAPGTWVDGEAWRYDRAIGLFVILERCVVGLLPASEPHRLHRGDAARFRVTTVHPDQKLELSLRGLAHEELEHDAATILAVLSRGGAPRVGDKSTPEEIRDHFGLSKKAFKRAVGRLLRDREVVLDAAGHVVPSRTTACPGLGR